MSLVYIRARTYPGLPQFAAEDCESKSPLGVGNTNANVHCWADCADTGVIRTTSRQELLYTRSYIAVTAKAHKLKAIDMVRQANIGILSC